jgi:hypothetical protein
MESDQELRRVTRDSRPDADRLRMNKNSRSHGRNRFVNDSQTNRRDYKIRRSWSPIGNSRMR